MRHDHGRTRAVRAGIATGHEHGAVVPPLHLSSTFAFDGFGQKGRYDYTRSGNPTRDILGAAIAELEGGSHGIVTGSGMSAITTAMLEFLSPGDLLLYSGPIYGGTDHFIKHLDYVLRMSGNEPLVQANSNNCFPKYLVSRSINQLFPRMRYRTTKQLVY